MGNDSRATLPVQGNRYPHEHIRTRRSRAGTFASGVRRLCAKSTLSIPRPPSANRAVKIKSVASCAAWRARQDETGHSYVIAAPS